VIILLRFQDAFKNAQAVLMDKNYLGEERYVDYVIKPRDNLSIARVMLVFVKMD
jgi:hypothetical protein